ncbi:TPA: hypothetical protein QH851_000616 [Enterobacter asburiae]|nr:hypothetical protein [Enterobacter asburiae]
MFAIVAVVPAGLAVIPLHGAVVDVITPANTVQLRQAVVRDLLSRSVERVHIPAPLLLTRQRADPGAVVLPATGPAAWRRAPGVTGEDIPAMQAAKTVVLAAGGQQSWVGSSHGGVRRRHTDSLSRAW